MFIARAAFWIAVVSLLMPHEPGHGGTSSANGLVLMERFEAAALKSLIAVRMELAARRNAARSAAA